jgi:hypothetical protein
MRKNLLVCDQITVTNGMFKSTQYNTSVVDHEFYAS